VIPPPINLGAIAAALSKDSAPVVDSATRAIGAAFTDTLLNVSLRGLDDTQVLGSKLVAELLKRGLEIVPVTNGAKS
jgi:hypothetical protein